MLAARKACSTLPLLLIKLGDKPGLAEPNWLCQLWTTIGLLATNASHRIAGFKRRSSTKSRHFARNEFSKHSLFLAARSAQSPPNVNLRRKLPEAPKLRDRSVRSNAERAEFVGDALHSLGHLRLRVHGESMLPTLWPDDVVNFRLVPGRTATRRDCSRSARRTPFLHRLVRSTAADSSASRRFRSAGGSGLSSRSALGRMDNHAGAKPAFPSVTLSCALDYFCATADRAPGRSQASSPL